MIFRINNLNLESWLNLKQSYNIKRTKQLIASGLELSTHNRKTFNNQFLNKKFINNMVVIAIIIIIAILIALRAMQ